MTFVRTVVGDVDPGELGVTYAHEHLVIDGGRPVELFPDFLLADLDRLADELADAASAGLRSAIDAMPADCGRNPAKLAELSRRSGAFAVYDQAFRWGDRDNGTVQLIEWAIADGTDSQVMLGMDAARQGYYRSFGGSPGLAFLLREFSDQLGARGISGEVRERIFVGNPARAFSFAEVDG